MFLFVTVTKAAVVAIPGSIPVQEGLHFTTEHLIATAIGFLGTFVLYGILGPIFTARRIRKEQKREDERADLLKEKDAERATLLKERDTARELALRTKEDAKNELDTHWHDTVMTSFSALSGQVQEAMRTNKKDNDELWKAFKEHAHTAECTSDSCRKITVGSMLFPR